MTVQADLLGYLGQQLVAHGAVLFAVLTAAFTFMGTMRPKNENRRGAIVYVGVAGILIGAGLYTLCRMFWYGALVNSLMRTPSSGEDVGSYFKIVVDNAKTDLSGKLAYRFIVLFSSSVNYYLPLIACAFAGIFVGFLIFLIGVVKVTWRLVLLGILFLLPAVVVIVLALLQII